MFAGVSCFYSSSVSLTGNFVKVVRDRVRGDKGVDVDQQELLQSEKCQGWPVPRDFPRLHQILSIPQPVLYNSVYHFLKTP